MKSSFLFISFIQMIVILLLNACDKLTIEKTSPPLLQHQKDEKPDSPVPLGSIRAYFGEYYRTFSQQMETVQPVDSFSNIYFYDDCNNNQINMIRCDSFFVFAMYLSGYSLESLPVNQPLPEEYGKYPQIDFYPFGHTNWGDPSYFSLAYYVQKCVFIITDKSDDILTGTFDGMLISSTGSLLPISEGEFRIKLFRKKMLCIQNNPK
jgi:hypothetical protein